MGLKFNKILKNKKVEFLNELIAYTKYLVPLTNKLRQLNKDEIQYIHWIATGIRINKKNIDPVQSASKKESIKIISSSTSTKEITSCVYQQKQIYSTLLLIQSFEF